MLWICLKYEFSDIGSSVFSNQYKICIQMIYSMTQRAYKYKAKLSMLFLFKQGS